MPKDKAVSFRAFVRAAPKREVRCETCTRYPDLLKPIRDYLRLRKAGKIGYGLKKFRDLFLAKHGYTLSWRALENHVGGCVRGRGR